MTKLALFRVNGGNGRVPGLGHVMRCLALAKELKKAYISSQFVIFKSEPASYLIKEAGFELQVLLHTATCKEDLETTISQAADFIFVDSYDVSEEYLKSLTSTKALVIYFDDLIDRKLNVDVVIGNAYTKTSDYKDKVEEDTLVLAGPAYTLLRKEFHHLPPFKVNKKLSTLLITMGGHDPENVTLKIVQILKEYPKHLNLHLLIGKAYEGLENLKEELEGYPHQVTLHENVTQLVPIFNQVDMAISAGGIMTWELSKTGVPTLLIQIADNQKYTVDFFEKEKWGLILREVSKKEVFQAIQELENSEVRKTFSEKTQQAMNKGNEKNLVEAILKAYQEKLLVREIKPSLKESPLLWEWRNDPETRKWSRNDQKISWDDHQKWLSNLGNKTFFFGYKAGVAVGVVRFDEENEIEVSITINPKFRGQGIGYELLKRALKNFKTVKAVVKKDNVASLKIFKKCGFKVVKEDKDFLTLYN